MKQDTLKTDVIFRDWQSSDFNLIIALFPHEINDLSGSVLSYEHVGQHSGADYDSVICGTIPAKEKDYASLKSELQSLGYNLRIIKRRNGAKYLKALNEARKS